MGIALDLATALDPCLLAEQAGLSPDPWQKTVLRSTAPRMLLNCHRQSGKSTITAALGMHTALYQPGSLTLLLSPSERQSKELFKKCLQVYRAAGRPVDPDSETTLWLELDTGSRVVALPGKESTIRGFSGVDLLIIDEAARVPDELYYAVRPMLAVSGGRLVTLSTPWGKRGWWYEAWTNGGPAWQRVDVRATDNPRISPAFLEEERTSLPALVFQSEYLCAFVDTTDQLFLTEHVLAALSDDVAPLFAPAHTSPQIEAYLA